MNSKQSTSKPVITRFAPSPTGYIHVGNVRSALFPWLLARQTDGKFLIRIEDTDQARFVEGATELILDTLRWLKLDWDEGPEKGGPNAPYFQTERRDIYLKYAQKLIDKGLAYADPYSQEELAEMREEARANKRPFLYRFHRPENPPAWDGTTGLRFKIPEIKRYSWHDPVMGDLSAGEDALDDFIIIKDDGLPTYNFAHIVDDLEMGITHVIRGAEYIASTPKYLALYEALEITPPVLVCLPHILAPTGNKKLGKRDGAKSVVEYREDGYLPEAMLNFLATLGWNDGTTQEIFTLDELVEKFSLDRVQRSGARFDEKRLLWINGQWIRRLSLEDLFERCQSFWGESAASADEVLKKRILTLVQPRLKTLRDLPLLSEFFFTRPEVNLDLIKADKQLKKLDSSELIKILELATAQLEELAEFTPEAVQEVLNQILDKSGHKPSVTFSLIRYSITFTPFSPELNHTIAILGKDETLVRLKSTLTALN